MGWGLELDTVERYAFWHDAFNSKECEDIISIAKFFGLNKATVFGKNDQKVDESIRKSNVIFLNNDNCSELNWVFERITGITKQLNEKYFNFDLWGFSEGLQFTEYESPGGKYNAHVDKTYMSHIRKLSIVLQLTDENEYEGGDFQLLDAGEERPEPLSRKQGTILAFPSYTLHRVTPLTKGTRHSLVGWITGKPFR